MIRNGHYCDTCKHGTKLFSEDPCHGCNDYNHRWEPKYDPYAEMLEMLKRLEFPVAEGPWEVCYICGGDTKSGHRNNCELAVLIAKMAVQG